ncbi:MAG: maleylpyruvate isomerase N-terminal domain-containing protein [Pseudonocardiaceae bacterium]
MSVRETYLLAAESFAALVARLPNGAWDAPALGVWNLRDLVGHTAAAALTGVVDALDRPADSEAIPSAEGYYALAKSVDPSIYQAVAEAATSQARGAGETLGDHPAHAVHVLVEQVTTKLDMASDSSLVEVHELVGGMRLDTWLPTRTLELVVHSLDIAVATGVPAGLPTVVLADAAALAARIAVAMGDGPTVLRALTGRGVLHEAFSVV